MMRSSLFFFALFRFCVEIVAAEAAAIKEYQQEQETSVKRPKEG